MEVDEFVVFEGVLEVGKVVNGVLVEIDENVVFVRLNWEKFILKGKFEVMVVMVVVKEVMERGDMVGMCFFLKFG